MARAGGGHPARGDFRLRRPARRGRKTDKGDVSVHLGPEWYLENQDVKIEPKDKVEIKGSRVTLQGQATLIAAEVKKGDEVLKLRDDAGVPMWAGWRRG